jgi:hypothetical protein
MKATEKQIRQIIREEIKNELNEGRYNGPGDFIYDEFIKVIDQAEGRALGNDLESYENLLTAMRREINNRLEAARSHMSR